MNEIKAHAILLARGGSKGIVNKNLQSLGDTSLVKRTLMTAHRSNIFDQIILSSDDQKILSEANGITAKTHLRSPDSSNDTATSESALLEVLEHFDMSHGICFILQCTTPFVTENDLITIHKMILACPVATIVSGSKESLHHWVYQSNDNIIEPVNNHMLNRQPRQDGSAIFVENGGVYAFDIAKFKRSKSRFMKTVIPYTMARHRSIDIDDPIDLFVAQQLLEKYLNI
jgi:CMP-N-acetylneuraminic acid synthetase